MIHVDYFPGYWYPKCLCSLFALIKSHEKKSWNLDPRFWVTQVSLISRRKVDGNKQNRYLLIFCVSIHLFQLVVQWTLVTGVRRQMDALREGFNSVLPLSNLTSFSYTEVICLYSNVWLHVSLCYSSSIPYTCNSL